MTGWIVSLVATVQCQYVIVYTATGNLGLTVSKRTIRPSVSAFNFTVRIDTRVHVFVLVVMYELIRTCHNPPSLVLLHPTMTWWVQ